MAAANNASSVMDIEYDDMGALMSSAGIISFCVYTYPGGFNRDITEKTDLLVSREKASHVYFVGILSYLEMINRHPEQWSNWRVVIHTDKETVESNPKAFDVFKRKGAILGMTVLKGRYSDIKLFRGIFRNNRYYPLFIPGLDVPIVIRDADTIYESELVKEIINRLTTKKTNNSNAVIDIASAEVIPDEFIERISKWEHAFVEKIQTFKNKVIFTYDDDYSLLLKEENDNSKMIWVGPPAKIPKKGTYQAQKVRFLAGNLSKVGEPLPIEIWTKLFPEFLSKYITNNDIKSNDLTRKTRISDEVFLTEVIYPWCKEHGRAEFYKMNYVSRQRLSGLFDKYISKKYPINTNPDIYLVEEREVPNYNSATVNNPSSGPLLGWIVPKKTKKITEKKINRNKLNKNNQKLFNFAKYNGLENKTLKQRMLANTLSLNHPEVMMNSNFFFNPLTNDLSKKPNSLPEYFFGGKKYRRTHKRKTLKNRK